MAYKHVVQLIDEYDDEEFEALRLASMVQKKAVKGNKEEIYDEMLMDEDTFDLH